MPLSEYEQRVLEQMERQLTSDDPKLVHTLQGGSSSLSRWLLTGVGFLAGLGGLIAGTATGNAVVGVLGFVVMFGCVVLAVSPPRRHGPSGTVKPDGTVKPRKGPGRMQRLEERWDRRRDQQDGR